MTTCKCGCGAKLRQDNKTGYNKSHRPCAICGDPVKRSDTECCSKSCSAKLHWQRNPNLKENRVWNQARNNVRATNPNWKNNLSKAVVQQYQKGRVVWNRGKILNPCLSPKDRLDKRKLAEYKEWIKNVFERDNYTCQISGKKGTLSAHHLDGWNLFPEKRFEVSNGITILKEIHTEFHNQYGRGNNTRQQFEEFVNNFGCVL